ncbi:MAG: tetratricopeptide repeat protein [Chloroflexi bacterium]|nr:tetratricopeptide repeat protein [Chloroflexota bacterium]
MWLSSLEGEEKPKQPVSDEGLPDWMKPEAEEQPLERGEIPEWLNEPTPPAAAPEEQKFTAPDLPNWLDSLEKETHVNAEQVMDNQDLSDWLSGLDNEPGLELDPALLQASQRPPFPSQPEKTPELPPSDLPDWLSGAEAKVEEDAWQQTPASIPTEEAVPVSLSADLPDWLQGVEEESGAMADEDLPPWLHREQWEGDAAPHQAKPTSPSDWHPISEKSAAQRQYPPSPEPAGKAAAGRKAPARQPARQRKPEGQTGVNLLNQAKAELDRGDIPEALMHYGKLIKKGRHLEEIVGHLNDSLYRYPVEVSIWQALGDAYMRANRLKEALDAYNKAEELIR